LAEYLTSWIERDGVRLDPRPAILSATTHQ
jgi:hypothetical protein